jgi:hypothetical protein
MGISAVAPSVVSVAAPSVKPNAVGRTSVSATSKDKEKGSHNISTDQQPVKSQSQLQLSDEALAQIGKLRARDTKVRQHEAAHLTAAGGLATSGASFTYQKGPDGVNYAIGGEVGIDVSPGRTPQDTIERAKTIKAAALAPAEPSGPDLAVAAKAQQLEQQARGELAKQQNNSTKSADVRHAYGIDGNVNTGYLSVFA